MQLLTATPQPTIANGITIFPLPNATGRVAPTRIQFAKGEQLFHAAMRNTGTYVVTSGEVLIVRNNRPVDLVEAGELLDSELWPGATAIALTAGSIKRMGTSTGEAPPC